MWLPLEDHIYFNLHDTSSPLGPQYYLLCGQEIRQIKIVTYSAHS